MKSNLSLKEMIYLQPKYDFLENREEIHSYHWTLIFFFLRYIIFILNEFFNIKKEPKTGSC